jgi:tetratricopeptide (TPR) repeat protein
MGQYAAGTDLDTIVRDLVGSTDITRLVAFKDLAELLGELEAAVIAQRRVVEICRERSVGEEDADVATALNNLAKLLRAQGKYDEVEPLYKEVLRVYRYVFGKEHPWVATSLNNLATLLETQGEYDDALIYANQSLDINKRVLGNEHPSTVASIASVADILKAKGDYAAAEPLLRQVISERTRGLGNEHPSVASALNSLAALLETQAKYDEVEPLYRQSLAIDRKVSVLMSVCLFHRTSCQVYGDEHPKVATGLNNLAGLLYAQGKYDEAEPLYQQSLAIKRKVCAIHLVTSSCDHSCKVLGEEHPNVAASLNNLAGLLKAQGKYDEAEPLYRQSLATWRKVCAIHLAASSHSHS